MLPARNGLSAEIIVLAEVTVKMDATDAIAPHASVLIEKQAQIFVSATQPVSTKRSNVKRNVSTTCFATMSACIDSKRRFLSVLACKTVRQAARVSSPKETTRKGSFGIARILFQRHDRLQQARQHQHSQTHLQFMTWRRSSNTVGFNLKLKTWKST